MFLTAARGLLRQPALSLAATAILALGIGAATALFSTVNAALLQPLPYPGAENIYTVRTFFTTGRFTSGLVASEELASLEQMSDAVIATAATMRNDLVIRSGSDARQAVCYGVSEGFFDLFGVPMALGNAFVPEDHAENAPTAVVLSHALWKAAFGGRPDIVGTTIDVAGVQARVAGVAGGELDVPRGADLWWNLHAPPDEIGHSFEGYARLKPGVAVESLDGRLTQAMQALARKYPDQNKDRAFLLRPLLEDTVGDLGPVLVILFAATGLLLTLACVNVMNLLLARSTGRSREMAVRAALGASRRRIMAHLLAESLMLSLVGAAAGLAAAYAAVGLLMRTGGTRLPRLDALTFDGTVLGFVAIATVLTGLVVGVLPARRLADTDISSLMNESGRTVHGSRATRRVLEAFVVAEIAVAVALVAGAARLVRSFDQLNRIDPGDGPDSAPVAIVNQAFVRRFLGNADPLRERVSGFKFRVTGKRAIPEEVAIVGVAADVKYSGLTGGSEPIVYVPLTQFAVLRQSVVLTAPGANAQRLIPGIRAILEDIDPNVAVEFGTMSALVASSLERQRLGMLLMSSFGVAALLLTTIGVFGVMAYTVAQRTTEMAVRQALGATRSHVFWLVMSRSARAAGLGLVAGLVLAWWTGRLLGTYVYRVNPADPTVLGASAALVGLVAVFAALVPASRAARGELIRAAPALSPPVPRIVLGHEALDVLAGMKPERRSKVSQVERPRRCDGRQDIGLTKVECEVAQHEEVRVFLQSVHARLVLIPGQRPFPGQPDQVASGLEYEKNTREQFGAGRFLRQTLGALLGEQNAQIRRRIEVEAPGSLGLVQAHRLPLSSCRISR